MKYDPAKHHRRSIRLKGYDYSSPGVYFITLCVHNRETLLGEVVGETMRLNEYGQIAAARWRWLADQYPYIRLDEWVLMPNHMHGILIITDDRRGGSRPAPTPHELQSAPNRPDISKRKSLDQLIGAFKTVSAKHINLSRQTISLPFWQRNYYEHIVRNERELNAIRQYIRNNPLQWVLDRDNPQNIHRLPSPDVVEDYLTDISTLP